MKLKQVIASFLAVMLLAAVLPVQALAAGERETDYDYTIAAAEDLLAFAAAVNSGDVNCSAVLTADIDVSAKEWTAIGAEGGAYCGTFDGDGHSISYQSTGGGLFGVIGDGAVIKNLTVSGAVSDAGGNEAGGIVKAALGGSIINCTSYAAMSGSGSVGGIAGCAENALIQDCVNRGSGAAAGIVYSAVGDTEITGCVNYGGVTGGGIVYSAGGTALIENCVNRGPVGDTARVVGGIAQNTADSARIAGCVNYGEVTSSAQGSAGGIVGNHGGSTVSRCANLGTITGGYYDYSGTGGIAGAVSAGAIEECCNMGDVTGSTNVGGIAGYVSAGNAAITNCYNTGSISGNGAAYAGGIAANLGARAMQLSGCFNMGQVASGTGEARSIIAHWLAFSSVTASNNYYLEGRAADEHGTAKTPEEFLSLAALLGAAYKDGLEHPLLTWQEDDPDRGDTDPDTAWRVTISVVPGDASFALRDSDSLEEVTPQSVQGGVYEYRLESDRAYTYAAQREGYYSAADELPAGTGFVSVVLTEDERIPASDGGVVYGGGNAGQPNTITSGGTYTIGEGASGVMKIETTEMVTLTGGDSALEDLYIKCTVPGVKLTLKDVSIIGYAQGNVIDFTGEGNSLFFSGTNLIEQNGGVVGYAAIHVPEGAELTIGGVMDGDILYLYKGEQGAGIGGNGSGVMTAPEYNGDITFTQGQFFIKGSKQGALIGAGANADTVEGTPGDIIINGGILNLIANARGAAIGGAAGSGGASAGTSVYMNGGTLTVNVDYSGAAIGGGGYDGGNDQEDGGTLYYSGGSIRTYIDKNAVSADDLSDSLWAKWGVTEAGVNGNVAITADIANGDGTAPLYLCVLDTGVLGVEGERFTVFDGESLIYDGGLHTYRYVNEDKLRTDDDWTTITDTKTNWGPGADACLYVYLTAEEHVLHINGLEYIAEWDGEGFQVYSAGAELLAAPKLTGGADAAIHSIALEPPAPSGQEAAAVPEYRISADGGETWSQWQESPAFTGLRSDTAYSFQARYRAANTELYAASPAGNTVTVKTLADPDAFRYEAEALEGQVTASVSGTGLAEFADDGILTADLVTGGGGVTQVTVTLSAGTLAALAEETGCSLALENDLGLVRFDAGALRAVAADAGEYDAVLTITKHSDTEYSFQMTINGIRTQAEGGSIYIEIPYARQDAAKSVLVYDSAGQDLKAAYQPGTGSAAFSVRRLTDVTIKESAPTPSSGGSYVSSSVWDGVSLDVSWFTPGKSSYYISTPAQLMGLAALVNGIYNDEITTIVGNGGYIVDNVSDGGSGGDNESTDTYHYGSYDFHDATVYLTADLDMGGGSSCNYMPIGGQYLMTRDDPSTKISASFCGVFDGGGHTISNIYCDRYCSGKYGDGSSVGLIGRLGVHDNDPVSLRPAGAAVRSVAVDGYFYANRSVGGIVGKIGKTDGGAVIEGCANFATVISADTKGCGGIVGAGWNSGIVRSCYNAGTVRSDWANPTGGISGSNEITLENCYNVGTILAGKDSYAMAIGTNNGGAPYNSFVINCWYLEGSAPGGGYYSGNRAYNDNALTSAQMKTTEFVDQLGAAFAADTKGINNGYPVLSWQNPSATTGTGASAGAFGGSEPSAVEISSTTAVSNGAATVTVDGSAMIEAAARADKAAQLVISGDLEGKAVTSVTAVIPMEAAEAVAGAGASIRVDTPLGNVTLPNRALTDAVGYQGESLTVTVESLDSGASITAAVGGAVLNPAGGIRAAIPAENGQVAALLDGEGNVLSILPKSIVEDGTAYILLPGSAGAGVIDNAKAFADVESSDWYGAYVDFAASHELFSGVSGTRFDPDGVMTRAMLVTVLHRLEGLPAAETDSTFDDVRSGAWYAEAVAWASENGIVEGYGSGLFAPEDSLTREQMAVMLHRYMRYLGMDVSAAGSLSRFDDGGETSDWAEDAMKWAVGAGILTGKSGTVLDPGGSASRAEAAAMLQRLVGLMVR